MNRRVFLSLLSASGVFGWYWLFRGRHEADPKQSPPEPVSIDPEPFDYYEIRGEFVWYYYPMPEHGQGSKAVQGETIPFAVIADQGRLEIRSGDFQWHGTYDRRVTGHEQVEVIAQMHGIDSSTKRRRQKGIKTTLDAQSHYRTQIHTRLAERPEPVSLPRAAVD